MTTPGLRIGDAVYREMLQSLTEGIWQIDANAVTTFVNEPMAAMLGYSVDEMFGRHLYTFMDEAGVAISERNLERRRQGHSQQHDFEFLAKDGGRVYVIMEASPIFDAAGAYMGAIAGVVDITERKRQTDGLRESLSDLNFLREALDKHSLVSVTDSAGIITYANEKFCTVSQYRLDELIGRPHSVVNSGYHPKDFFAELWRTIRRGDVWQGTVCNRAKDGSLYWVATTIVGKFDELGQPVKFVSIRTDVTDCKLSEAGLQDLVDELDRFAYAVAHDLKSPMQALGKLAGWIADEVGATASDKTMEYLQLMQLRVKRLENHIDGLLRYAKYSHDAGEIRDIDVTELVHSVFERFGVGGTFRLHVAEPLPKLRGHRERLDQVFSNLIGNAIAHHTDPCGTVWVSAQARGDFYEFSVRDDGPGIDPAYHEKIFEMFTTLVPRDKKEGSGIGLGLVKRLVELEGGHVVIDSALGDGATIRFLWPAGVNKSPNKTEVPNNGN